MSNERLRAAILTAGMNMESLSAKVGVDPKTIERWVSKDRMPHRAHRMATAAAVGKDEVYLWPATETDQRSRSASQAEFVAIHANRGSITTSTWAALLDQTRESIDLLAYSASFLHDTLPDFDSQLAAKARHGVQVRLLFGDPTADAVRVRGEEEGIGELLSARCRLTWNYFKPLLDVPGVLARMHGCTLYTSVFRFDDALLANTHTFGAAASHSPLVHLQRVPGGRLFTNYLLGFERTWDRGTSITPADLS
jgi:transcriptional regulator with XRE-family HTH domain